MSLLKREPRFKLKLTLPSRRTVLATLIIYAVGFIFALIFLFIEKNERVFWDLVSLTVGALTIIFIGSWIMDHIEQG